MKLIFIQVSLWILIGAFLVGCSPMELSASFTSRDKKTFVKGQTVFASETPPEGGAAGGIDTGGGGTGGIDTGGGAGLPIQYLCSNAMTSNMGFNVKSSPDVKAGLFDANDKLVCQISGLRSGIVNQKKILIEGLKTACPSLVAGDYSIKITSTAQSDFSKDLLSAMRGGDAPGVPVKVTSAFKVEWPAATSTSGDGEAGKFSDLVNGEGGGVPFVLYDINERNVEPKEGSPIPPDVCDRRQSPLVIHVPKAPKRGGPAIELTSPLDGILFDILGRNASPVAHAKKLISWFTYISSRENYLLALPNSRGEVNGIDELFGNNTFGPDGKFAENGYDALRKHDGRRADKRYDGSLDGYITRRDEVFAKLRLWSDINRDGRADLSELYTLDSFGIESLDLAYDPNFLERDKYGNETRMKSVAKKHDGQFYLMYDLWFRVP